MPHSSGTVDYLVGDQHGTAGIAIDSGSLKPTYRYYDPYGNPVGATPANWPGGNKGFAGGTESKATALTNLGAREYQPVSGAFITPDPLLNSYDPQDLNAYAYAGDSPSTTENSSGQTKCDAGFCPTEANTEQVAKERLHAMQPVTRLMSSSGPAVVRIMGTFLRGRIC
ncbi:MAG: hypothetical protein J2P25_15230 [Nocardiopsaceae bacterium]|nr:hypothetical protein [Nocardiopsaceae bacterium]